MLQATCCTTEPGRGAQSSMQGEEPQVPVPGRGVHSQLLADSGLGSLAFPARRREEGLCSPAGSGASDNLHKVRLGILVMYCN